MGGAGEAGKAGLGPGTALTDDASGGGSSPLAPILIALATLAAISIAFVALKRRRESDPAAGSPVSPGAS